MDRSTVALAAVAALATACGPAVERAAVPERPGPAPAVTRAAGGMALDTGVFVVTLGTDTTIVERYVLRPDGSFETLGVTRVPAAVLRRTIVTPAGAGRVAGIDLDILDVAAGVSARPTRRTRVTFDGDTAVFTTSGDQQRVQRVGGRADMLIQSGVSPALYQLVIARALATPGEVDTVWTVGNPPAPLVVRGRAPGAVSIETPTLGTWTGRVDAHGRLLELNMGALGTVMRRVDWWPRVEELARSYAARDAAGTGLGVLSPRDTARARIATADIEVDYGRPARRGRVVFGGIVPWGEVWRTGANEATQLTTTADLELAGVRLPAGSYTLWTLPTRAGWTLIVNSRTGQWGTIHDAEYDVLRLPMRVSALDPPLERFTIVVEPEDGGGALRLRWEDVDASVPFRVLP
jgi:hypothetical protein